MKKVCGGVGTAFLLLLGCAQEIEQASRGSEGRQGLISWY